MNNTANIVLANKQTKDCLFRRRSPDQNAALMSFLGDKNWSDVMEHGLGLQGRHFNFFLGGANFFLFFNATGLLKNWKKQHFIYVVI